jgi:hypothetical protein
MPIKNKTNNDVLLNIIINFKPIQSYFHLESDGRDILYIGKKNKIIKKIVFSNNNQKVISSFNDSFKEQWNILEIKKIRILGKKARVVIIYPIEGVEFEVFLSKKEAKVWKIIDYNITYKTFR